MADRMLAVVAVGGNALITDASHKGLADQRIAAREAMGHVADMIDAGWNVIVTHGNGPQVGFLLRRAEIAHDELPEIPLDVLGADTQGATGYLFVSELNNAFHRRKMNHQAVALVTQTIVARDDPAFKAPSKPIGSFMTEEEAAQRASVDGWSVAEDAGRGWRRVVASPVPQRIIETESVRSLVAAGYTVVATGGGGIPVIESADGQVRGVEAVIDKDVASAVLAASMGADVLLIATAVEAVAVNFGKPDQKWLGNIDASEARAYLEEGQFGAGSMKPKIEAALKFLAAGRGKVIITSSEHMKAALSGEVGTTIVP